MAVVVTAASGFDLSYIWKNQASQGALERSAGGYYINAALAGEPPGRWWGRGAAALGFAEGELVEREPYEDVYRQIDPRTGEKLGRARGNYAKFADHLARLRAAEPHATAERLLELERDAAQATRQAPAYTDMTVSLSKSISIFHASIRENERQARLGGDQAGARGWADIERRYQEVLHAANRAGLEHVQQWAGVTRTGYHGALVDGQEPGRFEEGELIVTSWLQGTSRDGDPQDHIHNQIARLVRTAGDGKFRALDTMCLRQVLGAVQAVVATHVECGLTREFGVAWVPRADGVGNEIAGITQEQMDAYSTRTVTITEQLSAAVAAWTAKYGRAPNRRQLLYIRQAVTLKSRRGKEASDIDWDALVRRWDAKLGGELASIAPRVSRLRPGANPRDAHADATPADHATQRHASRARPRPRPLSRADLDQAIQRGLALTQQAHSTWTRADLLKQLALVLPVETRSMDPDDGVALLDELADAALAGSVEQVVCLEAPEWPPLPGYLRRDLDGRSVYTRPGSTRYATKVQLSLEEQLVQLAQRRTAPHLTRAQAARQLGTDAATLDAALHATQARRNARAGAARADASARGLRLDQRAAIYHALTSQRLVEVLVGPAGSGKTGVLAAAARAWTDTGNGPVIGITTAQAARNVLADAGVELAENSSAFLGHQPGRRGAHGPRSIKPGTLLLIDEASMMSMPDLLDIIRHAERSGAKVIVAGDPEQLAAVEAGGGLTLLADQLGYVQLTEAVRFTAQWERDASLRLRTGELTALDEYHEHGRIRGAEPDQAIDDAVRTYVAHYLTGQDTLLMVADHARCREVSRRIRDDLIHLGHVDPGPEIQLADDARASAGDLIICRDNDHQLEAGEPGRTLANGDTLRIEAIRNGTPIVRRALDRDPRTGTRRWTSQAFAYPGYRTADLAYAVTGHSAQGRTVRTGISLITGTEDRQWLYVAMTRGTDKNVTIAFTKPATPADPKPGARPAPELARHKRVERERQGLPAVPPPAASPVESRAAIAIAADILSRNALRLSASQTRARSLANADHLARLNAIWQGEATRLEAERYRRLVQAELPAEYAADDLTSPQATWLWRTLRAAENAGLDVAELVREAIGSRSLTGAEDLASVIDSRLRKRIDPLAPQPPSPWSDRIPEVNDAEKQRFLTELAVAMDARKDRIGEHLAEHPPAWLASALGPVPEHPLDRLEWQRRAADIGAYRELYNYDHPDEPIGPEPTGDSPDKRAAWHAAFAALGSADGTDLRSRPDGELLDLRATYQAETAWAPRHVGRELRQVRIGADQAGLEAIRARAEQAAASKRSQGEIAARHDLLARSWTAMETFYREQENELVQTTEVRRAWELTTEHSRRQAIAADTELRRRHPTRRFKPLTSAEPGVADSDREQLTLEPGALAYQTPERITTLAEERRTVQARLQERALALQSEESLAWPPWTTRARDAILQPPKPEIRPAPDVLERATEAEAQAER